MDIGLELKECKFMTELCTKTIAAWLTFLRVSSSSVPKLSASFPLGCVPRRPAWSFPLSECPTFQAGSKKMSICYLLAWTVVIWERMEWSKQIRSSTECFSPLTAKLKCICEILRCLTTSPIIGWTASLWTPERFLQTGSRRMVTFPVCLACAPRSNLNSVSCCPPPICRIIWEWSLVWRFCAGKHQVLWRSMG